MSEVQFASAGAQVAAFSLQQCKSRLILPMIYKPQCPAPKVANYPIEFGPQPIATSGPLPGNPSPITECYTLPNQKGQCTYITYAVPNLAVGGLNNQIQSVKQTGRYVIGGGGFTHKHIYTRWTIFIQIESYAIRFLLADGFTMSTLTTIT